jgi:hypothetical protein
MRYGAIGAAIGTLSTTAVLAPIKLPLAARGLDYPLRRVLRASVVPAVAASVPAVAVMLAVRLLLPAGAGRLFIGVFLGLAAALVVGIAAAGPARLREQLREIMRARPAGRRPEALPATERSESYAERRPNYTAVLADTTPEGVT